MSIRTKLADRVLPNYTRGEELFNMISHTVGAAFAIAALAVCVGVAAYRHDTLGVACAAIYGVTMFLLYAMSSVYHGLPPGMAKKVFQVIDHCAIFLLIAGTYTPLALVSLGRTYPGLARGLTVFIWAACAVGIVFNAIDLKRFQVLSLICYVGLGWGIALFSRQLLEVLPRSALAWIIGGGVLYTVGSVLYVIGKKRKYIHSVFHLFVLAGSVAHFVAVLGCLRA